MECNIIQIIDDDYEGLITPSQNVAKEDTNPTVQTKKEEEKEATEELTTKI